MTNHSETYNFTVMKSLITRLFGSYESDLYKFTNKGRCLIDPDTYYVDVLNKNTLETRDEHIKIHIIRYDHHLRIICKIGHWDHSEYHAFDVGKIISYETLRDLIFNEISQIKITF